MNYVFCRIFSAGKYIFYTRHSLYWYIKLKELGHEIVLDLNKNLDWFLNFSNEPNEFLKNCLATRPPCFLLVHWAKFWIQLVHRQKTLVSERRLCCCKLPSNINSEYSEYFNILSLFTNIYWSVIENNTCGFQRCSHYT